MKHLIVINGTMGVGKTAAAGELKNLLDRSVLLDGDWCWDMHPFSVTEETKAMVLDNISHLLKNFLECSQFEYVIFCWVMHRQEILDQVLAGLPLAGCRVSRFSLVCTPEALEARLKKDIARGLRTADVLERSLPRLSLYEKQDTEKLDVSRLSPRQAAEALRDRVKGRRDTPGA